MFTFLFVVLSVILKVIAICFITGLIAILQKTLVIVSALLLISLALKLLFRQHLKVKIIVQGHEVDMVFPDKDALGNWLINHIGGYDGWRLASGGTLKMSP